MKIISRFILFYYLRILGLTCAAFIGIYLLVDFFEKVDKFIDSGVGPGDYLGFIGHSIPFIFVQILPLAILTSMVLTLGGLGRSNEMTALRACGISLWRMIRPLIVLILLLCGLLLVLGEYLVPWNTRQLNTLVEVKLKGREQISLTHSKIWYRSGNRIINISAAQTREQLLQGVTLFEFDQHNRIARRLDIPQADFQNDHWFAAVATERLFDPQTGAMLATQRLNGHIFDLDRKAEDFGEVGNLNDELNIRQLAQMANRLQQQGYDATRQLVDLHGRLAAPVTCLVMGLLGIPFALQRGRQSNIALGVGLSLGIGAAYFILQSLVTSFGYAGALSPMIAAWTANILFMLFGAWLFLGVGE